MGAWSEAGTAYPSRSPEITPRIPDGSVLSIFLVFVLSYYVSLASEFHVVMSVTESAYNRCSVRLYLQLFVGGLMSYLCYVSFFAYLCCSTHIVLCFCFVFLRFLYSMFPVSLECPFLIAQSIFSNVYVRYVTGMSDLAHLILGYCQMKSLKIPKG